MKFRLRCAWSGWLAGLPLGLGVGLVPWANPYVALSLMLGGIGLGLTVRVAIKDGRP